MAIDMKCLEEALLVATITLLGVPRCPRRDSELHPKGKARLPISSMLQSDFAEMGPVLQMRRPSAASVQENI